MTIATIARQKSKPTNPIFEGNIVELATSNVPYMVLITDVGEKLAHFSGVVVGGAQPVGTFSKNFISKSFKQFEGEITLVTE